MARHNYVTGRGGVEPNVHVTPDKKWVVFTGQFSPGQRHVYAVEIGLPKENPLGLTHVTLRRVRPNACLAEALAKAGYRSGRRRLDELGTGRPIDSPATTSSTRRFWSRPAARVLEATGCDSP